jgi:hypothetical protein
MNDNTQCQYEQRLLNIRCIVKTKRSLKNFELSYVHTWERDNNFNKHWSDYTWNCYLDFTLENSFSIISNSQHYQIEINLCMYTTSIFWTLKSLGNTSVKLSWIQPQRSWKRLILHGLKCSMGLPLPLAKNQNS